MAVQRLTRKLIDLGLTEEEAEIYVFLTQTGPAPARMVARRFETNRMRTYRSLNALEEKGLVQRIMGRPMKFTATPFTEVLRRSIREMRHRLADLEENEEVIIGDWENLTRGVERSLQEPKFRIYQGRQQVYELLVQMIERAETEILLVTTTRDLHRLSLWGIDDRFRILRAQGKRVRVLTQIDEEGIDDIEHYLDVVEVRHVDLPSSVRFAIIDESEALTTAALDDSMSMTTRGDTGIWTDASSYVMAMRVFCETVWGLIPEASSIIQYLRTGRVPQEIRTYTSNDEFWRTFRRLLEGCERRVDIMVRRIGNIPMTTEELLKMRGRGVRIRILTKVDLENVNDLIELPDQIEVLHNNADTDLVLLLVDGRDILLNFTQESIERSVWSNMIAYVETMTQVFEDYWRTGELLQVKLLDLMEKQSYTEISGTIIRRLKENNWTLEAPGALMDASGTKYIFDITATNPERHDVRFCIDIMKGRNAYNKIFEMTAKLADLESVHMILASMKPYTEAEERLAGLYGIKLVHAETAEELASRIETEAPTDI